MWNSKHDALEKNDLNKRFLWIRFFRVGFCCNSTKLLRRNTDANMGRGIHILWPQLKVLKRMIGVSLTPQAEEPFCIPTSLQALDPVSNRRSSGGGL